MQFDEVFKYTGQYKKYQIIICLIIAVQGKSLKCLPIGNFF